METWGRGKFRGRVQFLCFCVESVAVAQGFGETFRFSGVVNGFIPFEHMPRGFGQLGSSGFIVVDGNGHFISKKTAAFLQVGKEAFQRVEELLSDHLSPDPARNLGVCRGQRLHAGYPYSVGSTAIIGGGKHCKVLGFTTRTGRFTVQLLGDDDGRCIDLLPGSLSPLPGSMDEEGGGAEGCDSPPPDLPSSTLSPLRGTRAARSDFRAMPRQQQQQQQKGNTE